MLNDSLPSGVLLKLCSYGIRVQLYSADFKREVQRLIEEEGVKAILMGNRRTDPWSQDLQ